MNEQLLLRYQDNLAKIIKERYCLDYKMYNFDDYEVSDFKFEDLDFYLADGRQCKILKYDWTEDGKWSNITNITVRCSDGEVVEYLTPYSLHLTEKSAIDFEVDKIIFKNVTNQEELDYMYELLMLKQK